jgi:DNA repair photolyase
VAPIVPGLTDHEMPHILKAAADYGATNAGYTLLRLPYGVSEIFSQWLQNHFPERRDKVLNHIRSMRDGKLNDPNFGSRMKGKGVLAENLRQMFRIYSERYGLNKKTFKMDTGQFERPSKEKQLALF